MRLPTSRVGRRFRRSSRRSRGRESLFEVGQFVTELCATSPEFAALWADNDVRFHGEGTKRLHHPVLGAMELEYSGFAVDGRPDLGKIVYNPVDPDMADRIRAILGLVSKQPAGVLYLASDVQQDPDGEMRRTDEMQNKVHA
ncbi:hypothetical protein [Sphingomonas sp. CFBP9019]|uniref:MmyB family transcriptional regulator n=1 Tax=Sphingomonas sp. CFBP9019 TaxID=3096532 RepID=UPI002A6B40B9|nr:hypothetical protein [Sphingomonas sp. CFBP9019]MDY1008939.1 hypothetical protein [Sphingomonas sp. CFBP9019]